MARNLLWVWLINALALLALPYVVPSVQGRRAPWSGPPRVVVVRRDDLR